MKNDALPEKGGAKFYQRKKLHNSAKSPLFVIFTDLDGTLLDHDTYEWKDALPALQLCKRFDVPVILTSSKTRAELNRLRRNLSISSPFISENGGGIFFPSDTYGDPGLGAILDKGLWRWSLGIPYDQLVKGLHEIRNELGWNIRGFSDMDNEEISRLTGLNQEAAARTRMREYDEPFIILGKTTIDKAALYNAASEKGLEITCGGRFYHLKGKSHKGYAMDKLLSWYRLYHGEVVSIALGDSPNDFSMLERADFPVLIRSQSECPRLKEKIPRLMITRESGPRGWNSAILKILDKKREDFNA